MRAITSREKVLQKIKRNNLISDGHIYYLSDFHKTKIGTVIAEKLISEKIVEPTKAISHWFEKEWRYRRPVGTHKGVAIFSDTQNGNFFFHVPKGEYVISTYKACIDKIDYLINIGERVA